MKKVEITLWVLSIVIPSTILVIGLLLLRPKLRKSRSVQDTSAGQDIVPQQGVTDESCGSAPIPCSLADPNACSACEGFVCTNVSANDTNYNVEGSFCLPPKPVSACTQVPLDPNSRMQGKLRWTGWAGVDVQAWDCSCPYPRYYPMDTTSGSVSEGACKRSSALCRHGTWKYPCKRRVVNGVIDPTSCEDLTEEETRSLVGSDPLMNGLCSCDDVPCTSSHDCAGDCVDGVCVGQRLSMNPRSGLPECVVDTCPTNIKCTDATVCPGGAECQGGMCQQPVCDVDAECGPSGTCVSGRCTWGKWEISPDPPYVFGKCACPYGAESTGAFCTPVDPEEGCVNGWCRDPECETDLVDGWCQKSPDTT
jgi:hypothetical protein